MKLLQEIAVGVKHRTEAYRNPVYLLYAIIGVALFILSALVAGGGVGRIELAFFHLFNSLGEPLYSFFWVISLFGSLGAVFVVALIALIRRHYANTIKILLGGLSAYFLAYGLKNLDIRARPIQVISDAIVREPSIAGHGFPSGHAAVATVLAITAYQYLPKRYHKLVTLLAFLVMVSRLYLGVHFPMDLVGGFAIGIFCGGLVNFLLGSRKFSPVSPEKVKDALKKLSVPVASVKLASVDARGSTPYMAKLKNGSKIFVKIVGRENNVADWLFKSWRKIIYRRLEDEAPFLNAKRQLEHEAYVSNMALLGGVRTPRVIGIFSVGGDRWAHAQEAIDGKSLDRVEPGKLTNRIIEKVWEQVLIMHRANIVHRDLRCANIFLDSKNSPWIIDFGFSEASMPEESKNRDRAELLASMATLVGAKRSAKVAHKMLSEEELRTASAYLSYSVLSSATTSELKRHRSLLPELRQQVFSLLHTKPVKQVKMQRFSLQNILIVASIALAVFVLLPRFAGFKDSWLQLKHAKLWLVGLAVIFSLLSYYFAAMSYKTLLYYPISTMKIFIVQVASSFASKLAPAGTGGIALNTRFLVRNDHSLIQAGTVSTINTALGFVGHLSVLLVVFLFGATDLRNSFSFTLSLPAIFWFVVLGGIVAVSGGLVAFPSIRKRLTKTSKEVANTVGEYRHHPFRLFGSWLSSVIVTLTYCGALYASAHALNLSLDPLQIVVVFTVGVAAASITPTPGGVGGAEAGLVASLTAAGLTTDQALSVTLLYRLITYWLPIIPGFIAFHYSVNKKYI